MSTVPNVRYEAPGFASAAGRTKRRYALPSLDGVYHLLLWALAFATSAGIAGFSVIEFASLHYDRSVRSAADVTSSTLAVALDRATHGTALTGASRRVDSALAAARPDVVASRAFVPLVSAENLDAADALLSAWNPDLADSAHCEALARHRIARHQWQEARWVAWECVLRHLDERPHFVRLWYDAHSGDPDFLGPVTRIEPAVHVDRLLSMNRSSSVIFRYMENGRTMGVFKPDQDVPHTDYRGEIATWRLCTLIRCNVLVPYNHEVRVAEHDLSLLSGIPEIRLSDAMIGSRGDAVWHLGDDGRYWLYGTYKEWIDDIVRVELERYAIWRPLLKVGRTADELRTIPLREAFDGMPGVRRMVRSGPDVTAHELAHQLSDMHVIDALIGNFDRFHDHWPGLNIHWAEGQMLSLDNGAAFLSDPDAAWDDPLERLSHIELFSRESYDAIRWMDTDALFRILLPESPLYDDDEQRWELFLERRTAVLAHIDGLIGAHGEDTVLIFP